MNIKSLSNDWYEGFPHVANAKWSTTSVCRYWQQCHWLTPTNLRNSAQHRNWAKWRPFHTSCIHSQISIHWDLVYQYFHSFELTAAFASLIANKSYWINVNFVSYWRQLSSNYQLKNWVNVSQKEWLLETESLTGREMCHVCWQSDLTTPVSERSRLRCRCRAILVMCVRRPPRPAVPPARPVGPRPPCEPPRTRTSLADTSETNFYITEKNY